MKRLVSLVNVTLYLPILSSTNPSWWHYSSNFLLVINARMTPKFGFRRAMKFPRIGQCLAECCGCNKKLRQSTLSCLIPRLALVRMSSRDCTKMTLVERNALEVDGGVNQSACIITQSHSVEHELPVIDTRELKHLQFDRPLACRRELRSQKSVDRSFKAAASCISNFTQASSSDGRNSVIQGTYSP